MTAAPQKAHLGPETKDFRKTKRGWRCRVGVGQGTKAGRLEEKQRGNELRGREVKVLVAAWAGGSGPSFSALRAEASLLCWEVCSEPGRDACSVRAQRDPGSGCPCITPASVSSPAGGRVTQCSAMFPPALADEGP